MTRNMRNNKSKSESDDLKDRKDFQVLQLTA